MAVYLIGFAISIALIALTEKKQRTLFIISSFFALLIPCLIAALRSDNIGTDVQVYITKLMDSATKSPSLSVYLEDFWDIGYRNQYVADYEYGFSVLLYLITKLTHSTSVVLFVIQALGIVPVFLALARNRKHAPVWIGMLVYYFLFYNASLNAMRQFIAMGFLLLAFSMLQSKKNWSAVMISLCSLLFHYSAILVLPVYAVYWVLQWRHKYIFVHNHIQISSRTATALLISGIALLAIMNLELILNLLPSVGLDRFSNYLVGNQMSLMINQILLRLPIILLFVVNWKPLKAYTKDAAFFLTMLLLDMVAAQLISVDTFSFRISQYFLMYLVIGAPALYACQKKGFARTMTVLILIAYLVFYWYYTYVLQLRHGTIPYEFRFF